MSNLRLINVEPFTRINDRWLLDSDRYRNIVAKVSPTLSYKNFIDPYANDVCGHNNQLPQTSFLQIVTETVYHYPNTFISEKTIKPILSKRPFVILGPKGSLNNLRSIGFKTFSSFWDESYDTVDNPEQRLLAVVDIVESICRKPIEDLQSLCVCMSDVLNFNFQFYIDHFKNNELFKLEQSCIENLKPRYDPN